MAIPHHVAVGPYQPHIEHEGQQYVDQPVVLEPTRAAIFAHAVSLTWNPLARPPKVLVLSFDRIPLRWTKRSKK